MARRTFGAQEIARRITPDGLGLTLAELDYTDIAPGPVRDATAELFQRTRAYENAIFAAVDDCPGCSSETPDPTCGRCGGTGFVLKPS